MSESIEAISIYTQAYHELHGRMPNIRTNNGWIKLNNGRSYRPHEIREMASILRRRASEERTNAVRNRIVAELAEHREEESNIWDVREELNARVQHQIAEELKQVVLDDNNESHVQLSGWKKHIRKDVMVMFFNRLFEKAGNSAHTMQRMMDDFIHHGYFNDECNCDDCEAAEEADYLRDKYEEQKMYTSSYKEKIHEKKREINKLEEVIRMLKIDRKKLKKNSVIFSMEEF